MKAMVYPEWDVLEIREVPEPAAGAGEVVLQVAAVGICGSELEAVATRSPRRTPPLIMGHEFCGEVATVGEGVTDLEAGDRVVASSVVPCWRCSECRRGATHLCRHRRIFGMHRPGAFAELVAVPASVVFPLPERVGPLEGALVEPLANAVHVWSLLDQRFPETVAVIGCGTIGLMTLQVARAGGALTLIALDVDSARLEMAHAVGAEPALNPAQQDVAAELGQLTRGRGVDVVIDAVGAAATRRTAVELVRSGGEVVWIGLHDDVTELPARDVVLGERRISGSYAVTARDMETAIGLFAHGRIDVAAWVHPFGLNEGPQVFRRMLHAPPAEYAKAILLPT